MVMMHVWFIGLTGHSGEFAGKSIVGPLFFLAGFFCLVEFLGFAFGVLSCGIFGLGGLNTLGQHPRFHQVALEVFNVWGWLTHGDLALEAGVDFLAVVEHRLIPVRVASIRAPACQDSSHVGNAGVGVISMRGALVALPTFATAQFERFFDCGRAVRCLLPLGGGIFMHLVVLCGYHCADTDAEQVAETALADAHQFCGVLSRPEGLVLGWGECLVQGCQARRGTR